MTAVNPLVVALPGSSGLATALARSLRCECIELALHQFPDGETLVRLDAPVKGRSVVFAGSLDQPDARTLALLFAADTARELGALKVGLVAPYLAYMRQDKRFQPGEAVTSRSYARLLSNALDFLVTVDPHLHRWRSLDDIYTIPTAVVPAAPLIARWLARNVAQPLLIGPDSESAQWVAQVARLADAPWAVMAKTRRGDRDVTVKLARTEPWPGRVPVLLDDIVSTGQTLVAATAALTKIGLPAPVCIAVHALFDTLAMARLKAAGVRRIVSCDSIAHSSNAIRLHTPLAQATRRLLA